jgi:hypothetical protein
MVPYDVPKASLDLLNRFLDNRSFMDYLLPERPQSIKPESLRRRFFPRWRHVEKTDDY